MSDTEGKAFECPICFDYLFPPIYQCFNGHLVCQKCIAEILLCPICREPMPEKKVRNLVLENLTQNMEFDCKNKNLGCPVRMKQTEFKVHVFDCAFQNVPFCHHLGITNCAKEVNRQNIIEHFKRDHSSDTSGTSINANKVEFLQEIEMKENSQVFWTPHFVQDKNQLYFLTTQLRQPMDQISWRVLLAGSKKAAFGFRLRLKLINMNNDASLTWEGQPLQLDSTDSTLTLPMSYLKMFGIINGSATPFKVSWKIQISFGRGGDLDSLIELDPLIPILRSQILYSSIFSSYVCRDMTDDLDPSSIMTTGLATGYHPGLTCDNCKDQIVGVRYKCMTCMDYDLCEACESKGAHEHKSFVRIVQVPGENQQKQTFQLYERNKRK